MQVRSDTAEVPGDLNVVPITDNEGLRDGMRALVKDPFVKWRDGRPCYYEVVVGGFDGRMVSMWSTGGCLVFSGSWCSATPFPTVVFTGCDHGIAA